MEVALLLVNALVLSAVACQAYFTHREVKAAQDASRLDHDRRRKQATIDYWTAGLEERRRLKAEIRRQVGTGALSKETVEQILNEEHDDTPLGGTAQMIMLHLDRFEYFCAGINGGVYDLETADALCGNNLVSIAAAKYNVWIAQRRRRISNPHMYIELEKVAADIAEIRRQPSRAPRMETPSGSPG